MGLSHTFTRVAARVEQEIRAYPRVYNAFYNAVTRSPRIRQLVGRTKDRVRADAAAPGPAMMLEEPEVRSRREAAVAARLGLSQPGMS